MQAKSCCRRQPRANTVGTHGWTTASGDRGRVHGHLSGRGRAAAWCRAAVPAPGHRCVGPDQVRGRFTAGLAAGDLVLKLFPPLATWPGYRVEAEVLTAVQGKLPIPTPQVHAAGEHNGWGYALMSRLPGVPLDTVWDQLSAGVRDRLAGQLGETIAALHQLPPPAIRDWWPADWPAFCGRTARAMCRRAARSGLARDVGGSDSPVPR